jgi:uncharacterized protein (DUF305 family)
MVTAPLAPRQAYNDADLRYLRGALLALADALGASDVAAAEASDPAVRALAERVAGNQAEDIRAVTALLVGWSSLEGAPGPAEGSTPEGRRGSAAQDLRSRSGLEVDLRFLQILGTHTHAVLASTRVEMIEGFGGSSRGHAEAVSRRCWQELRTLAEVLAELTRATA